MKQLNLLVILLALSIIFSCSKEDDLIEDPLETFDVVINELLPKNSQNGSDEDGDFDDWIELYNLSNEDQDLSNYYLTDSKKDLTKWQFPAGTVIEKNGYLIIWADDDPTRGPLHTNYKLSADGETVVLLSPDLEVIDLVEYPATLVELSYARKPNGTGEFSWTIPTYNASND